MPNGMDGTLAAVSAKIAKYVEDAATLTVVTAYVEIGGGAADFSQARVVARTITRLDGDSEVIIPMRPGQGGNPELDAALFELHQRNVAVAAEYRHRILSALVGIFQQHKA